MEKEEKDRRKLNTKKYQSKVTGNKTKVKIIKNKQEKKINQFQMSYRK